MSNAPAAPGRPAYVPPAPLEGSARTWGTIALSAATFMNVLDTSIANVSLPAIAGDLGVSPNQGTWVITSFAVANAIALPLTGWLSQRFNFDLEPWLESCGWEEIRLSSSHRLWKHEQLTRGALVPLVGAIGLQHEAEVLV